MPTTPSRLVTAASALAIGGALLAGCASSPAATTQPASTSTRTSTASAPATTTPSAGTSTTYTMATVAGHKDAASCWAAVNGSVYDLTAWINQHPGGAQRILGLCGTDATAQFTAQHRDTPKAIAKLATFAIGKLG